MADEKVQSALLSEIMQQFSARTTTLESLFSYLRSRMLDLNEQDALAILQAIQGSDQRRNLPLQDFAHDLHRQALHAQMGDTSLSQPGLSEEVGNVQLDIPTPTTGLSAEAVLFHLIVEWARLQQGQANQFFEETPAIISIESSTAAPVVEINELQSPVDTVEGAEKPLSNEGINAQYEQALRAIDPELANFLTRKLYTLERSGLAVLPKKVLTELIIAHDAHDASVKFNNLFHELATHSSEELIAADEVQVDKRWKFHTFEEAIFVVTTLLRKGQLRTTYKTPHAQPTQGKSAHAPTPTPRQDRSAPSGSRGNFNRFPSGQVPVTSQRGVDSEVGQRRAEVRTGAGHVIFDRKKTDKHSDEPGSVSTDISLNDEITLLMNRNRLHFGAHFKWVKTTLAPLVVKGAGEREYFVSVDSIHTDILGGFLIALFDKSFREKCIAAEGVPGAVRGKYLRLEDALQYIFLGYSNPKIQLICME